MKAAFTFQAEARERSGKGSARALRRQNKVPAILYGQGEEPLKLALPDKDITLAYHKGAFASKIVELKVGQKSFHALPRDVQLHPVTDKIEHADFQRVDAKTKIKVFVPVRFHGVEKSAGIKRGGVLNVVRHELELICLPGAIPSGIDVDIQGMDIGHSVHINDVKLPSDVTPAITNRNFTIATVAGRSAKMDEDETPTTAATAEGAAAEGATVEGGAAAAAPAKDTKDAGDAKDAKGKKDSK